MSDPKPLPDGYRQRMDALVLEIMPIAERIMDLSEEFGGDSSQLGGDNLRVRIDRQPIEP